MPQGAYTGGWAHSLHAGNVRLRLHDPSHGAEAADSDSRSGRLRALAVSRNPPRISRLFFILKY